MKHRGIVIASFGDRDHLLGPLLNDLQKQDCDRVVLYTDHYRDFPVMQKIVTDFRWRDHPRWAVRNTNLILAKAAMEGMCDVTCCLNDDMRIVHDFRDGFDLAERFGMAVPMNPRVYVKYNAMGADGGDFVGPEHAPACNVSPMFVSRAHRNGLALTDAYIAELSTCMRGTLALWNASWRTGITPVYLPEQWCVCESNAAHIKNYRKTLQGKEYQIEPIMLHWGHAGVREVFKDVV